MPKHAVEIFGQVIYAPEMSYDELLGLETSAISLLTDLLEDLHVEFLAFESDGDRTFFQCALGTCDEKKAGNLAARLAEKLDSRLECKFMCVDRMLFEHLFFAINRQEHKEMKLTLPEAGPIDKSLAR